MKRETGYWDRHGLNRTNRRGLLRGAAIGGAGLAGAALIACGGRETAPTEPLTATQEQQPKRGGILRRMGAGELRLDFDPHTDSPSKPRVMRLMYQTLVAYHPETYAVEPELAQKWEQPDNLTLVLQLQPGVKWHNKPPASGRLLTVDDVVFSLERIRTPDPTFQSAGFLKGVKIEAVDASTVKLTTASPDAGFLNKLSGDQMSILARDVVAQAGKFATVETAVGTGPFVLKSRTEVVGAEYERNPEYWKPGHPYLDGIRTYYFAATPPDARAYAAFLAGQLDVVVVPGEETTKFLSRQGPDYKPLWYKADSQTMATPNVDVPPLNDARVTKALRLLIDHEEMKTAWVDTKLGKGTDGAFLPPACDEWDLKPEEFARLLEWKQPKDDAVKEALSLLNAAGFTRSNPLKIEIISDNGVYGDSSELVYAQWRQLSQGVVTPDIRRMPSGSELQNIRSRRQFSYFVIGNGVLLAEIDANLTGVYRSDSSRNFWGYKDPTMDAMIDKQRTIFDVTQRKAAVRELNLYMIDKHPGVIVANRLLLNAAQPQVRNFYPELHYYGRQFENVWLDT